MMGNECIVDSMGFIRAGIKSKICTRDILHSPLKEGISIL